jgi:hypothetical protein
MLLITLLTFLNSAANPVSACDEVLGVCLQTWESSTGALLTDVTGTVARNLFRDGDETRYMLIAGQHVITAVNGSTVATKAECLEALKQAAGSPVTLEVLNIQRGTTRTYVTKNPRQGGKATHGNRGKGSDRRFIRNTAAGEWQPAQPASDSAWTWETSTPASQDDSINRNGIRSQLERDSFNRNYPRNSDHRSVYGN